MSETSLKGQMAEEAACCYLVRNGFEVRERRYRIRGGETDIICVKNGTLHFVEVRYRKSRKRGNPAETVGFEKRRRLMRCAMSYISERSPAEDKYSMDIIEISGEGKDTRLNFIENAFC